MECTINWLAASGMGFVAETGSGHVLVMDGAPDGGGRNLAPRPMETVLAGTGGCTAYDVVLILKRGRHDVRGCQVKVTSERATVDPKVFTKIHMHFTVTGKGLSEVANPSALFLGDRTSAAPGTAVFAGLEGTRPLLCEIQALVSPCAYGSPRRAVVGWDTGRLAMILAVLDARAGVGIGASDVYLNVAGGLKIAEPAADLAAAAALVSSFGGEPLPRDSVFFGEISLSGDIRPVSQAEGRLKEAAKLGFKAAFVPKGTKCDAAGLQLVEIANVAGLLRFAPEPQPARRGKVES